MKWLLFTLLLLAAAAARAQSPAGDPDAIDFSAKMDTIANLSFIQFLNAGVLKTYPYEDFYIGTAGGGWNPLRYGGPSIFDRTSYSSILQLPKIVGDFTGTGRKDIIDNIPEYHKRVQGEPYYDSLGTTIFTVHGRFPQISIEGVADCNQDGIDDLLVYSSTESLYGNGYFIYYGSPHIADSAFKYPDDSLPGLKPYADVIGTFSKQGNPMIFLAISATDPNPPHVTTFKIGVLHHLNELSHDTVLYLSHTSNNDFFNPGDSMIAVKGMYAMDITGDGITDLLVTDNVHIWIFKGSDSLGYYPLTKNRAYYAIPNPKLLDPNINGAEIMDYFGEYMHACGDLTGSGIPFLMVNVEPDVSRGIQRSWAFFYAGGKALDSLYDASVMLASNYGFDMDTLHSIDNSGRSAVLLHDNSDFWNSGIDLGLLLYKGADKIPHKTNPRLAVERILPNLSNELHIISGNGYVKLDAVASEAQRSTVTVYNILGQQYYSNETVLDPGENVTYLDTKQWANGTYIAAVRIAEKVFTTKFIVQH